MFWRKFFCLLLLSVFAFDVAKAGVRVVKSNGVSMIPTNGVQYIGTNGITLTGADGFLNYQSNGITVTGADGTTLTSADGITVTGADGAGYTGTNGITVTGADGITVTGADGITVTGADGITVTGADGTTHRYDSIVITKPNGITVTGADGITVTGADGYQRVGENGITVTGADGITVTGADGITVTGADSAVGFKPDGTSSNLANPNGITVTGADGITVTGADGITVTGADGITVTGADNQVLGDTNGLQSFDPELAVRFNQITDDSNVNAVIVYHRYPSDADLERLRQIGITGGTRFRKLPMIVVTATRSQLIAVSRLTSVRTIYGNRTLQLTADPYFNATGHKRVNNDDDLKAYNQNMPISGRNVTVAVLDTGINSQHGDLTGRVVQNIRLADTQSLPVSFVYPTPAENQANTDLVNGHGTFVAGIVAGSGLASGGKYNGIAPGAKLLGLGAGDLNLSFVLSGFDYLLDKGASYNVKVVNCSFSANTVFDYNDPVNVATKMLTERGINVVFSAGNTGSGTSTLNPYAAAPWVIGVGATDHKTRLADFSSRGVFGSRQFSPSLVAPGVNVVSLRASTSLTGILGFGTGADSQRLEPAELPFYTTASGTSFSAPQVAAAIALMLEVNPNLNPAQIKDILQRTATPLPPYFGHEVGAGMLNVHAAVLESAFPERRMGLFRAILEQGALKFTTAPTQNFNGTAIPGTPAEVNLAVPADTLQASVHISWGDLLSVNDLGLKLFKPNGNLLAESNYLNLPGITGKREKVTVDNPQQATLRAAISHTGGIGTAQNFVGALETTGVQYASMSDISNLSPENVAVIKESLRTFMMLPEGQRFRPDFSVTRAEFAAALVRGARVPQYVAGTPMFTDVTDLSTRNVVESVQSLYNGALIYDADNRKFRPYKFTSRLAAAIALVRAAKLENLAATTPLTTADAEQIPVEWRGHVAVAIQKGLLTTDGANFNSERFLTRLELAQALVRFAGLARNN